MTRITFAILFDTSHDIDTPLRIYGWNVKKMFFLSFIDINKQTNRALTETSNDSTFSDV